MMKPAIETSHRFRFPCLAVLASIAVAALLVAGGGIAAASPRPVSPAGSPGRADPAVAIEEEAEEEVEWEWGEEEAEEEAEEPTAEKEIEVEIEFEAGKEAQARGTEFWPARHRRHCRHRGRGRHNGRGPRICRRSAVAASSRV
jgi:hypothetical protein